MRRSVTARQSDKAFSTSESSADLRFTPVKMLDGENGDVGFLSRSLFFRLHLWHSQYLVTVLLGPSIEQSSNCREGIVPLMMINLVTRNVMAPTAVGRVEKRAHGRFDSTILFLGNGLNASSLIPRSSLVKVDGIVSQKYGYYATSHS